MPPARPGPTFGLSRAVPAEGDEWAAYLAGVTAARGDDPERAAARAAANAAALAMEEAVCGPRATRRQRRRD